MSPGLDSLVLLLLSPHQLPAQLGRGRGSLHRSRFIMLNYPRQYPDWVAPGTSLVDLQSREESAFVSSLMLDDSWTGGREGEGAWGWQGGAPWTWSDWPPPGERGGGCLGIKRGEARYSSLYHLYISQTMYWSQEVTGPLWTAPLTRPSSVSWSGLVSSSKAAIVKAGQGTTQRVENFSSSHRHTGTLTYLFYQ